MRIFWTDIDDAVRLVENFIVGLLVVIECERLDVFFASNCQIAAEMLAHRIVQGNTGRIDEVVAIFVEDGTALVQELCFRNRINGAEELVNKFLHEHLHAVGKAGHEYDHLVSVSKSVGIDTVFLQLVAHVVRVLTNHVFHEM